MAGAFWAADWGVIEGDLRACGIAGGGINGSDNGSGETESCELSLLPKRKASCPPWWDFDPSSRLLRPLSTSSELTPSSDFLRACGRTDGDCCFLARAENRLVDEGPRRCLRDIPGDDGVSPGDCTKPISGI